MRLYVSASWQHKDLVQAIQEHIRNKRHKIEVDWTQRAFTRNYEKFLQSSAYAAQEAQAVLHSDVLLHLSDGIGKGKYVDIGIAIGSFVLQQRPRIYVLGAYANESQFYFHPAVQRIKTTDVLATVAELF